MIEDKTILSHILMRLDDPGFTAELIGMLHRYQLTSTGGQSMVIHYRRQAAVKLLDTKSRADAVRIMVKRFGISRSNAYELIQEALNIRQRRAI